MLYVDNHRSLSQKARFLVACIVIGMTALSIPSFAFNDSPQTFTLDGQLFLTGTTTPLLDTAAKIKVQILNPAGTCVLYEEQQTVNTRDTSGYFNINVGSATGSSKRTINDPGRTMNQIFQNLMAIVGNNATGQTCAGGVYNPSAGAIRYVRLIVTPSGTNNPDTLTPDLVMDAVPNAVTAQSVEGLERANILQTNTTAPVALSQANLEALFTTPAYTNLQTILAGNFMKIDSSGATLPSYASNPSSPANGEMWFDSTTGQIKYQNSGGVQVVGAAGSGTISSLTVGSSMSMNGTVAGTISNGSGTIDLSNTGISAGTYTKLTVDAKGRATAGTVSLVESDIPNLTTAGKVSGNTITSGTISGSAGVNTTGNLITTGTMSGLNVQATNLRVYNGANYVQMTAGTISGNVNFTLPTGAGSAGQILSTDGNGVMSWINPTVIGSLGGDVSGALGSNTVQKIQGKSVTAGSVSGQMMIYDGTQWVNNVMSGDATLAYTGILTLNKVPVSKGGTNTTSYGNNHIIVSNGTGSALTDVSCSLNQVLSFDASGYVTCANVNSLSGAIVNGGNSTGADISIGTNDNKAFSLKVNNTVAMTISQNGLIGIGTANPTAILDVQGGTSTTGAGKGINLIGQNAIQSGPTSYPGGSIAITGGNGYTYAGSGQISLTAGSNYTSTGGNLLLGPVNYGVGGGNVSLYGGNTISGTNIGGTVTIGGGTGQYGATIAQIILQPSGGNVGIGISMPTSALDISGAITAEGMSSAPSNSASNTGRIYYDYSANKFKVSQNGGAYVDLISSAATNGFLNGGNAFGANATLGTTDNKSLSFITNNTTAMTISQNGDVYIGSGFISLTSAAIVNMGIANTVGYNNSAAIGRSNTTGSADTSVAIGIGNAASRDGSSVVGLSNTVGGVGYFSQLFGRANTSTGGYGVAIGNGNTISADGAIAVGISINNSIANSAQFGPSDTAKITVLSTGNVGIGTTAASSALSISNPAGATTPAIATTGAITSNQFTVSSGSTIDFSKGNVAVIPSANAGTTSFALSNMVTGGAYTVIVHDTGAHTYSFSGCTTSFLPANAATTGTYTVYSILYFNVDSANVCTISWVSGF